jgi:hypothetical protein
MVYGKYLVRFGVLIALVKNNSVFWDIMLTSLLKVNLISEEHVASIVEVEAEVALPLMVSQYVLVSSTLFRSSQLRV